MTTATTLLQATGLTKSFSGNTVLHGVNLHVREGELLSVMGPSGSGKSTLLYTVSGMDSMTSGAVMFAGHNLADMRQKELAHLRLTSMGFIFQHVHLLKNLCLLDNVVLPAYLAGLAPRAELNDRAMHLMERAGVAELAQRDISEASGGQLQRVGDRRQHRYVGAHLDQRQADLTQWLMSPNSAHPADGAGHDVASESAARDLAVHTRL